MTKTLTNRLKEAMDNIIASNQSSFVPGRNISDKILIYQEVLHSMRTKSTGRGFMTIKIDLEKASDRLSWQFLRETLNLLHVPSSWVQNIMQCVETTRIAIIWNGKQLHWFKPTRGIRQGDPISPYLFVLCMERIGHIIHSEVNIINWKPIQIVKLQDKK